MDGPQLFWQRTYGGTENDLAYSVVECQDGGFLVVGSTECYEAMAGDLFIIKIDEYGEKTWQRTYGGDGYDSAHSVLACRNGGFLVVGWTESFGGGVADAYLVRIDGEGEKTWERTYGGA